MTTILTVDDSRTMREMLRVTLRAAGFEVLQAKDGLRVSKCWRRSGRIS